MTVIGGIDTHKHTHYTALIGGHGRLLGHRHMIAGVVLIGPSAVVFALAPNVAFLFAGRVLQGAGAGLAMGAGTAALIENNTTGSPRFASSMATLATATGLTLALVVSGALAQFFPMPLFWNYIVLLFLSLASIAALWCAPEDRPRHAPRVATAGA